MNKEQKEARNENIRELALAYPGVDAEKLQDELHRVAAALERNAMAISSGSDCEDKRPALRDKLERIKAKFKVNLVYETNGDPRGYPLKLTLPTGRSNSWDGEHWGIKA